ncbi:MAG: hypothetical protein EB084_25490 [Proteobacteria bacterium]|nr:hypothetical protein [Pseudomonadota bacterium]
MHLAVEAIDATVELEQSERTFKSDQIRVSSIGKCARKSVAQALGLINSSIPWKFNEGGHVLEERATTRILRQWPLSIAQVSVPTSADGTWTHPDLLIVFELEAIADAKPGQRQTDRAVSSHGVQIKSTRKRSIAEYLEGRRDEKFGLPKPDQVDQALLEWYFWRRAGFCLTREQPRRRIEGFPQSYELLYLGQEDFGGTRCSIPIEYDEQRAEQLAQEFTRRVEALQWGELVPAIKREPDYECAYTPKTYDFDGPRLEEPSVCGMYEQCWGKSWEPKERARRR